jgi:RNA polymerase sigma-70 factor, ECF subfamily
VDALTRSALAARTGDRGALDQLVEGCYEQVWRLCARLVDDQCADDLTQDTFIHTVRALPNFRGDASARTWILAIARNRCIDELRTRRRRQHRDASLGARLLVDGQAVEDIGQEVGVSDALAALAPQRREAFVLTQLLGLSYQEAAEVCSCPPGTIRSRVARARADLIDNLEREGQDRSTAESGYANVTSMYPITRPMTS